MGAGGFAAARAAASFQAQHFLYFLPLPQGHGPFRSMELIKPNFAASGR
jgi:hypothetical protein